MDVRTIESYPPRLEHEGSTKVWWLVDAREMFAQTRGGHLHAVSELELPPGGYLPCPAGEAWTFWYVTSGRGRMRIGDQERPIAPGDMVVVPPGAEHEVRTASPTAGVHLLNFAVTTGERSDEEVGAYHPGPGMDIRSIHDVQPEPWGDSGATVWWLVRPGEFGSVSAGGHLELVDEFEVDAGGEVHPHSHPTWEFYYGLFGRGLMTIAGEERVMGPGDLVVIPPDAVHSIKPVGPHTGIRCFCFAVGLRGSTAYDYSRDTTADNGR